MDDTISTSSIRGFRARTYDIRNSLFTVPLINRRHIHLITLAPQNKVLDVGCGTGKVLMELSEIVDSTITFHGIDSSPEMIMLARRRLAKRRNVSLKVGRGGHLAYGEGTFDWIITCLTTHHLSLEEKRSLVDECYRSLRPGGKLLISDFGKPSSIFGQILALIWRRHSFARENMEGILKKLVSALPFRIESVTSDFGIIEHIVALKLH